MKFAELPYNQALAGTFAAIADSGRIPHALMLHESDGGGGAFALALAFLQYLYCRNRAGGDSCGLCPNCNKISKLIHPDLHFVFPVAIEAGKVSQQTAPSELFTGVFRELALANPAFTEQELYTACGFEGKNPLITVAEANALVRVLSLHSLEGGYTSVLIYLPERMHNSASNKLLKLLEEPPAKTLFILITHAPEKLLPTIVSRCQMFHLPSKPGSEALSFDDGGMLDSLMEALVRKDLSAALAVGEKLGAYKSREKAKSFCRYAAEKFRRVFLVQQGLGALAGGDAQAEAWAKAVSPRFPRRALEMLDRSVSRIDRNINLKILFTDLVDRMYVNI